MEQPKWKEFEKLVARIQADLAGNGIVTHDDKIVGNVSGVERQIDVSIRSRIGQYDILIVIECKDHRRPLDVKDVEEFIGLAQDVGANKAAMVAAKGFSEAAKNRAIPAGLELYQVVDSGDHPWKTESSVPALYECSGITEIGFESEYKGPYIADGKVYVGDIELFDLNETSLGKFQTLIHAKWNRGAFPKEPGHYCNLELVPNPVKVPDYKGVLHEMNVYASIKVEKRRYFGHLALAEVSGLRNVVSGATSTKRMVTEGVGPDIEKKWTRIESLDDLAVKPVMTFICSDYYETGPEADI
jgi:hypothetical protein